ncbi:MAG TPA: hypothetical protein VF600_16250 [Abditibacteriaceae bacterium]|jgi:hypothetical protein
MTEETQSSCGGATIGNVRATAHAETSTRTSNNSPLRIAMWSGPRNISTAMLRSWGNRLDTSVCDEPLYAHYLWATHKEHPMAEEVVAHGETDWRKVVAWLTCDIPPGKSIFYQKHMAHHLLPHIGRDWLGDVTNCFLIRHPADVINSYIKKQQDPAVEDLGYTQQVEIFDWVRAQKGVTPPVVDARDVLHAPERMLQQLCEALGIEFSQAMLSWPPGLRSTDGIWAKHWYSEVQTTTFFRPYQAQAEPVPDRLRPVCEQCIKDYEYLYEHRLR